MKVFVGLLMLVMAGISAQAQEAKVLAEMGASSVRAVKNSPFSADAVSESVQTLADGNRIVHSSTSKLYRNSEGRSRREMSNGSGGLFGTTYSFFGGVNILDPVAGNSYLLDEKLKTAQQALLRTSTDLKIRGELIATEAAKAVDVLKLIELEKLKGVTAVGQIAPVAVARGVEGQVITGALSMAGTMAGTMGTMGTMAGTAPMTLFSTGSHSKYESKTEQLGTQNIEGVEAEGTRTTTTIPAGAIGNERPIEITYERWYSKELQLVVMSKNSDPRSGEQTYRLTNIVRNEPDPSLFTVPHSYRLITQPTPASKATAAVRAETERSAIPVKATATASPVPAAKGRPQ